MTLGAIISPVEAGLILRGLRTLELRVDRSAATAQKVFEFLKKHPKIAKIYYPFDPVNTDFYLAKSQMKQGGGLLSIQLKATSVTNVEAFCNSLKHFLMATSWGGYESLIFPLCALAASKSFENPLPWDMVRLYIGLEDAEILIQDLSSALDKI
jgi:cystathionine beta-lyase/cystathionine gamma-synthase